VKWLRPYENNADTGNRIFLSGFAVQKQMLAEGKNKAKQTAPPVASLLRKKELQRMRIAKLWALPRLLCLLSWPWERMNDVSAINSIVSTGMATG